VDGIFLEVHEDPDRALCDGPNSVPLDALPDLLAQVARVREAVAGAWTDDDAR
jgi:2-dehydro-3-deoxyphosphooctonate aldolase (KDO 8-P synthase)